MTTRYRPLALVFAVFSLLVLICCNKSDGESAQNPKKPEPPPVHTMAVTSLSIHYNGGDCQQYDSNGNMVDFANISHGDSIKWVTENPQTHGIDVQFLSGSSPAYDFSGDLSASSGPTGQLYSVAYVYSSITIAGQPCHNLSNNPAHPLGIIMR